MKKIAIASCYFKKNYGSMLQAYATQLALDRLGYENETIDVSGFEHEVKRAKMCYFLKASLTSRFLAAKFGMLRYQVVKRLLPKEEIRKLNCRAEKFEEFERCYFRLSDSCKSLAGIGKKCEEEYSAVLVGSDQLWLPGNIAGNYFTLSFVPESVNSIAYATSFGQSTLPKDSSRKAQEFLAKIRHLSVREESGQQLVQTLCGRQVPVVCDPTLLFTGKEWLDIQQEEAIIKGNYIFCYYLGNNPAQRLFATKLCERTGCKIVALIHLDEYLKCDMGYADETPFDVGPAEFLNLIRYAQYVCTDSFHCSVFSMQYQKEFFAFRRYTKKTKQSTNSRLDTLFRLAGLQRPILFGEEALEPLLKEKINYELVNQSLAEMREGSYRYLRTALEDKESTDL